MDKRIFQIRLTKYFSSHIQFYAFIALCAGLSLLFDNEVAGGLFFTFPSLIILTAQYGLQINFQNKTYRKFGQIIGLKTGSQIPFDTIDYLFINSGKVSQTMNYKSLSTTIHDSEFNGYIKFDNKTKLHLLSSKNKNRLVKKLKAIANASNSRLIDYSDGEPKEI